MTNCVGAPDEQVEEKELRIVELEERCEQLEKKLFKARQESKEMEGSKFPKKSKDEQEIMIKDLTKSNALLRRKLDDALQKINDLQTN